MKLRRVCLTLLVLVLVVFFVQVLAITNSNENKIGEKEERRAADVHPRSERFYNTLENYNRHSSYHPDYESDGPSGGTGYAYSSPPQHHPHHHPQHSAYGHDNYYTQEEQPHYHSNGYPSAPGNYHHSKALTLKGLLIPLAGIALLGAAAALTTNPVLLQLGVVNAGRRRKRSTPYIPKKPIIYSSHYNDQKK